MLNDELSDLANFAAVADARSFTRAAAKLRKSQSALSQSVRGLEERLKLRLLTRTTRSVMPTPAGEQLLSTLRPALGETSCDLEILRIFLEESIGDKAFGRLDNPKSMNSRSSPSLNLPEFRFSTTPRSDLAA